MTASSKCTVRDWGSLSPNDVVGICGGTDEDFCGLLEPRSLIMGVMSRADGISVDTGCCEIEIVSLGAVEAGREEEGSGSGVFEALVPLGGGSG